MLDVGGRFYPGNCEDCSDLRPLVECKYPLTPEGSVAELCEECAARRRAEADSGEEPREIGLIPIGGDRSVWVNLPAFEVWVRGGKRFVVQVIFRRPTVADYRPEDGGEIKFKFPDSDRWVWGNLLDLGNPKNLEEPRRWSIHSRSALRVTLESVLSQPFEITLA